MTEHHWVVCYNTETGEWSHEADVESAHFDEGTVFDGVKWKTYNQRPEVEQLDEALLTKLNTKLQELNEGK